MIKNELKTLLEDHGVFFDTVLYYRGVVYDNIDEVIDRLLYDEPELGEQIAELTAEDKEAKEELKELIHGDYTLIFNVDRVADGIRAVKVYLEKEGALLDLTSKVINAFRLDSAFNGDKIILKGWGYSASYHIVDLLKSAGVDVNFRSIHEI